MRKMHKLLTVIAMTAAVAGLNVSGATAANANPSATGPGGDVIKCDVTLDNPHNSGHFGGTISAQGIVNCNGRTVNEIYIKTSLRKINNNTVASQTFDSFNVAKGSSVGAKPCSDGPATFKSQADVIVHFPAGFVPASAQGNYYSPQMLVACGNARFASAAGSADLAEVSAGQTHFTITATK